MAVTIITLCLGSPSATLSPDLFLSPSPGIRLLRAVTFFAAALAVCVTYGCRSWRQGGLGQLCCNSA
uniref:Uncharacterized protein n=1 Tax=Hyaloperonospora arabidopsidis (strain Emoy2) TaxID=559515 RepID=M4B8L6_HYAAE